MFGSEFGWSGGVTLGGRAGGRLPQVTEALDQPSRPVAKFEMLRWTTHALSQTPVDDPNGEITIERTRQMRPIYERPRRNYEILCKRTDGLS